MRRSLLRAIRLLLTAVLLPALARAQGRPPPDLAPDPASPVLASGADGSWELLPPPSARINSSMVLDTRRDRLSDFGGNDSERQNDTWVLDLAGPAAWRRLDTTGPLPPARSAHSAIYDPVGDRMIVFGGFTPFGPLADLWALSLSGTPTWSEITPPGAAPDARSGHTAIYDAARQRMILFGGQGRYYGLSDAWSLSLSGPPAWSPLPYGRRHPPLAGHVAVLDPQRDRMVVFGGYLSDETWELSLSGDTAWTQLTQTGTPPSGRRGSVAICDTAGQRLILFGGSDVTGTLDDTWSLSLSGAPEWVRLSTPGATPGMRTGSAAVFDAARGRMLLFGGAGTGGGLYQDDTWALSLAPTPSWSRMERGDLPWRSEYSTIYDPLRERLIAFGGYDRSSGAEVNETWALSLSGRTVWTRLSPTGTAPAPRWGHSAIYDPARGRMIVFGGVSRSSGKFEYFNDTWALSLGAAPAWTELTPAGPGPLQRSGHTAVHDALHDRMIVFGGAGLGIYSLNDTWALDLDPARPPSWTRIQPATPMPMGRIGHGAVFDPVRDRLVIFGGLYTGDADLWALDFAGAPAWSPLAPSGTTPQRRNSPSTIYDPVRHRMVMFGGYEIGASSPRTDAWELAFEPAAAWRRLSPVGATRQTDGPRAAAYDIARDRMIVSGFQRWALGFGEPARPAVSCLGPAAARGTGGPALVQSISTGLTGPRAVQWTLDVDRHWPGWPLHGTVVVPGGVPESLRVEIPVPDSAAAGVARFHFACWLVGAFGLDSECDALAFVGDNAPDCSAARAQYNLPWPPDHSMVPVKIAGVTDPDGDPVTLRVTSVRESEPVGGPGDGGTCPDALLDPSGGCSVRAERSGGAGGRAYEIVFTASDGRGGACEGRVRVCVPHDRGRGTAAGADVGSPATAGPGCDTASFPFDALACASRKGDAAPVGAETDGEARGPFVRFTLLHESQVNVDLYDVAGRRRATLLDGRRPAGTQRVSWDPGAMPRGIYFCLVRADGAVVKSTVLVRR